jgi:hypothetical protein
MLYFDVDTAQGLTLLSNGFMRDDRVFHINQPNWIEMYNQQGDVVLASLVDFILTNIQFISKSQLAKLGIQKDSRPSRNWRRNG